MLFVVFVGGVERIERTLAHALVGKRTLIERYINQDKMLIKKDKSVYTNLVI